MGRLRGDICRCLEPRPEAVKARSGRVLARQCKRCLRVISEAPRARHDAAVFVELDTGELGALCISTARATATADMFAQAADVVTGADGTLEVQLLPRLDEMCPGRRFFPQGRRGRPNRRAA